MSFSQAAWVVAGLFLAGVVKGASGIGYSTFALPVLVFVLDLASAMAVITLPVPASNLAVIRALKGAGDAIRRFWPMYLGLLPGTALGAFFFSIIDREFALRVLGGVTLAYVLLAIAKPAWRLGRAASRHLRFPVGLATGAITGMTGSQVVPLVPFVSSLAVAPRAQVQAINVAVTLGSLLLFVALCAGGVMTTGHVLISGLGVLPAIAGVALGARIAARLSQQAFRAVMLSVLTVIAGSLIVGRDALRGWHDDRMPVIVERQEWARIGAGLGAVQRVPVVIAAATADMTPPPLSVAQSAFGPTQTRSGWADLGAGLR